MTELIIRYAEPSGIADKTVIPSEVVGTLVRCKDCRHGQYDATHYFCAEHYHKVYEDDYCSYGERGEESEVEE